MSQLMEQARALLRAGRWLDVRAMESNLLSQTGEDLILGHAFLYTAYERSASNGDDWFRARSLAHAILDLAPKDSPMYFWSLQVSAAVASNLGLVRETTVFAKAFLREASARAEQQHLVPYAWQNLGVAANRQGHYRRAIQCYRIAAGGFRSLGKEAEFQRVQMNLVWNLIKAGRPVEAAQTLPDQTLPSLQSLWHASKAYLAAAKADWGEAAKEASLALQHTWSSIDNVQAAEMCLLMAQVNLRHGARAEAISWTKIATEFRARLGQAIFTRLILATAAEGGDFLAAVASRGSGGYHPDACFSTGVGG